MAVRLQLPNVHGLLCFDWAVLWGRLCFKADLMVLGRIFRAWVSLGGKSSKISSMACVSESDVSVVIGGIPTFRTIVCLGIRM